MVYRSYCRENYAADQCVSQRSNPEHFNRCGYDIRVACTFFIDETISIYYLKRRIHIGLKLLPSHFNIIISARINTAPPGSSIFL
jgi:hypothetical protein